ncbi:MAG: branched-chain amino acid ABC transporter permease [Afipia sp.]|jgi:branched-chain amino acid transport system permease protein|nr:branched-chain amino acid ABC transporter permease [Afipia sp.]
MNLTAAHPSETAAAIRQTRLKHLSPWLLFASGLIVAPLILSDGASLSMLCQLGTMMLLGLSFNMLFGQSGMLSFGHAVYSGLGAYFAAHVIKLAGAGLIPVPISLVPLLGGLAGMFFGVVLGYVTTKKSGTIFAMITLGIGELISACALMMPEFFGGEGGVSFNRVIGQPFYGLSFGPQIQVYYLIAAWLFVCTLAIYVFTLTPLGRMTNAVRDNPERAEFIGYDTQRVRYLTFILSSFFAGIAGALGAINFEIVTAENVSSARSGAILLFTFIGGVDHFFGPLIGAAFGVFFTELLSNYTRAWQLYLGIFFILIVMYAPGGISSLLVRGLRPKALRKAASQWPLLLAIGVSASLVVLGTVSLIEMLFHHNLEFASGPTLRLFGISVDTSQSMSYLLIGFLVFVSGCVLRWGWIAFQGAADEKHADILLNPIRKPRS